MLINLNHFRRDIQVIELNSEAQTIDVSTLGGHQEAIQAGNARFSGWFVLHGLPFAKSTCNLMSKREAIYILSGDVLMEGLAEQLISRFGPPGYETEIKVSGTEFAPFEYAARIEHDYGDKSFCHIGGCLFNLASGLYRHVTVPICMESIKRILQGEGEDQTEVLHSSLESDRHQHVYEHPKSFNKRSSNCFCDYCYSALREGLVSYGYLSLLRQSADRYKQYRESLKLMAFALGIRKEITFSGGGDEDGCEFE